MVMGVSRLIASGLGTGYLPKAPGTWGSLAAIMVGVPLMAGPVWLLPAAALVACGAGFVAIPRCVPDREADPSWVVIDEVAGQWIALLGLGGLSVAGLVLAFVGFRLLDIVKPGPVGWADRQPGAFGIMADDILAGAGVALALLAARWAGAPL